MINPHELARAVGQPTRPRSRTWVRVELAIDVYSTAAFLLLLLMMALLDPAVAMALLACVPFHP
ncbi:hypothetical protein ACLI4A_25360, partial [Pseudomonas aeruginosa]